MFEIFARLKTKFVLCLLAGGASFAWAGQQLDKSKYISIEEIRPGMDAYCLTAYEGTEVEKFGLDVLSVVRDARPGRDAILVRGTDERFIHTGPVWGCSGSPVYIEGRLAGALAFSWTFSKDPVYGVTPIEEMFAVGQVAPGVEKAVWEPGFRFDFSKPLDFDEVYAEITRAPLTAENSTGAAALRCPLITYGLPAGVVGQLNNAVEPFGLTAVAAVGWGQSAKETSEEDEQVYAKPHTELAPGACLAVPLITGDMKMEAVGTVTEVVDDKVYGFGHSMLGFGPIDLPMATGEVHTVISSRYRSFKFASAIEIVGALTADESAAVLGRFGAEAKMIPLTIRVDRYNDAEQRVYNCRVVNNRLLTPFILRAAVAGAAFMRGSLPPDHKIEYRVTIGLESAGPIVFENVSTGTGLGEVLAESIGSVAILMNNPYEKVDIQSIHFDVNISTEDIASIIWSTDLSDSKVKAGEQIEVSVVVESPLVEKRKYEFNLSIPDALTPGKYELVVCGGRGYHQFLRKAAPYKFVTQNMATLIEAMNSILTVGRDKLYCLLVLPPSGVTVARAELPDLPATKALLMQDAKRALATQPYRHWLEKSLSTGTVIMDKKVMHITVEE
jgi:hypothetical protein